ncbi:MAG TPA: NAD(P)H-hydrate dehydratase [Bacteroidales bacterium]|nr:NAD(P)H-hydrate dehydratase [Bacteroidales bacterium]
MKILPVEKIREADAYTIAHEPVESVDLMERAAMKCYNWLKKRVDADRPLKIFCGPGNNGGDGLAIARMMAESHHQVSVYVIRYSEKSSRDFLINYERLTGHSSVPVFDIKDGDRLPEISEEDVVVDALFGSGLNKPAEGFSAAVIRHINASRSLIVAIDMPSGLFCDMPTDEKAGPVVRADYTLTFQAPKLAFLFAENDIRVGEWVVLDIGLHPGFTDSLEVKNFLLTREMASGLLKPRTKFAHKGHFGHALLIAGGYGRMGAAVLAAEACLRSGVGLLHAHAPAKGVNVIQTAVPEAMITIDADEECLSSLPDLSPFTAIGIGPGIGFDMKTKNALKLLIQNTSVPMLFDADALTILAENRTWISFVPRNSVFTPHPKEFERLAGKATDDFHRNRLQREFCIRHGVWIVLKGAHSCICGPDGVCYFNTTGNPGMATGGSGDVLTGLILGLLAQRYSPRDACLLGVFLHGLAGDLAAKKIGMASLLAGDITRNIGKAFKKLSS